jgi:DNA-directed RNA polymerase subunit beta'
MGHIELAAPVAHIWFLKSLPSRIGTAARHDAEGCRARPLLRELHRHRAGPDAAEVWQLLTEEEYITPGRVSAKTFTAMIGAEADPRNAGLASS